MDKKAIALGAVLTLAAAGCGGGGGGDTGAGGSGSSGSTGGSGGGGQTADTGSTQPLYAGFDFSLKTGDFWEYGWREYGSSYAMSDTSSYDTQGEFRITLGDPVLIEGVEAFPMELSGQTRNYVRGRWQYIAVADNKVYVSADGASLKEVFDAQDGTLLGNGFFSELGSNTLYAIESGTISNDFIQGPAYAVSQSFSDGQCEYFPEVGQTICGSDMQTTYKEKEYFLGGVGPLGYYYYNAYSSCGGGFCSGSTDTKDVGLVASSLRGDTVDYELEQEPDNTPAVAHTLTLPAKVKGGFYDEDSFGATVTYSVAPMAEVEPNDSHLATQTLTTPVTLTGDALAGEHGEYLTLSNFPSFGTTYNEQIEDWYTVTPAAGTLSLTLDFAGPTPADFDLFVMRASTTEVVAYSIANNLATGNYRESASFSALNEPYYVMVDAYNTNGTRVGYTLNIAPPGTVTELRATDWYRFTAPIGGQLSISATGGAGLVLVDAGFDRVVAYDYPTAAKDPTAITKAVKGGVTYLLGVVEDPAYSDRNYALQVDVQ